MLKLAIHVLIFVVAVAAPALGGAEGEQSRYAVAPLLAEIKSREAQLDRRERDLADSERTHGELVALIEAQLQEVTQQRAIMQTRMDAWGQEDGQRIKRLAKIYEAMEPRKAADLLDGLNANLATQIIRKMKYKKSAAVIERISDTRALTVTRQVAHPLSFDPAMEEGDGT